jgi:hypothetical protein
MNAEIELRQDSPAPVVMSERQQWADELVAWAAAAQRAHEIASVLCETAFVPKSMQHRPGDVTGAILTGMELGVPVMWALSNIDIVDGTPAIRAKGLRGLLKRHGHEIWVEESTATRAVVCARHKDSSRVEKSTWTIDRAKKAELVGKKNWRLYPQDMLVNRATAEAARLAAPDVLFGVAYTVDELGGDELQAATGAQPDGDEKPPAPVKRRTMQRAKPEALTAAPEDLPTDVPQPPDDDQPDDTLPDLDEHPSVARADTEAAAVEMFEAAGLQVETLDVIDTMDEAPAAMVTDAQRSRMAVEMRKAGIVGREERLTYVSDLVGRRVESGNELTVGEASRVIQALVDQRADDAQPAEGDDA